MSFPPAERLPRVVLDSNVWIDILVFDDPATRPIAAALANARIDVVIDHRCRSELSRVLDYPQFARFAIDKDTALARVDGWTTSIALPDESVTPPDPDTPLLPQCRDRDDQKFLELAHRAGAGWLVSKDRELLRMAKRIARDFGFSIGLPAVFVESRR
ncbi:MAG TPA: putative toxin-antitoxin system toxin component, PIN family, partial [Pararobbsia sp.]|nr:putative toxin-antitoxin system toxin component, PIN family [Pararobbsia sp.]